MWIFGYGSLIWRPDFEYEERVLGFVRGWARRFYQGSPDHRGVPQAPGRVVTLLPRAEAITWGMAYRIEGGVAARVLAQLDHREQGGYEQHFETVYVGRDPAHPSGRIDAVLMYIATPANPSYLGPASAEEIARHVARSRGPSGPNSEYVLRLAEALQALGVSDPHVFEVARHLRRQLGEPGRSEG